MEWRRRIHHLVQLRGFSVPRDWAAYTREHILVREKALYSAKRVLRSAGLGSLSVCVCVCVCADTKRVRGFSVLREWCVYTCVCTNTHTHTHTRTTHADTHTHTHHTHHTHTYTHTALAGVAPKKQKFCTLWVYNIQTRRGHKKQKKGEEVL